MSNCDKFCFSMEQLDKALDSAIKSTTVSTYRMLLDEITAHDYSRDEIIKAIEESLERAKAVESE